MKLDVFGRMMEVIRENNRWVLYLVGEGKRRRANDIIIPENLDEAGVIVFLEDVFHEIATPEKRSIKIIG